MFHLCVLADVPENNAGTMTYLQSPAARLASDVNLRTTWLSGLKTHSMTAIVVCHLVCGVQYLFVSDRYIKHICRKKKKTLTCSPSCRQAVQSTSVTHLMSAQSQRALAATTLMAASSTSASAASDPWGRCQISPALRAATWPSGLGMPSSKQYSPRVCIASSLWQRRRNRIKV